ncbi:LLM class flavin-dependent oxidoreductase [Corticibacter populi]|uniref:LLM class flavin-dependent oxidoreductase n=1 Tax=Corticibacter populi TaxID=1550736 RepID=A0A3M6R0L3_9BURK|nr:NtaA/DmoA family FMN-dependent monooxygenase [Corticibacter populi]RMX08713.1 LLM class flavin-dependent oxidoreductase [Corticibacter populi]RZS36062.1 FMN-dependent oxidoreductase (nitrilotriacetate monooxygenase family) [Corticibacter populi]
MKPPRRLHFNSCIDWLEQAWREPCDQPPLLFDLSQLTERARLAERGCMNALFMADFYTYRAGFSLEPLTLLSALASVTRHIGVIGSVSTTYNQPYDLARLFASLDHLSAGRAGWNMVTTAVGSVAANYSEHQHLEHDLRYERAHEVIEVVTRLWDSWDDDALCTAQDRAATGAGGGWLDPDKIHPIDYHGHWFDVPGPLNLPRPPQGHPVRMQAGSSHAGRDFGARWAEVIFTAQPLLPIARDFYADVKQRAARFGRDPEGIRILPGLMPIIAPTRAQAEDMAAARALRRGRGEARLREFVGVDLSVLPPDEPIPLALLPEAGTTNGMRGRSDLMLDIVRRYRLTPRQLQAQEAHHGFVGTPEEVTDLIHEWFEARACDGFTMMWPSIESNQLFVEQVVPALQRRGIHRKAYDASTLRGHFDLPRPLPRRDHANAAVLPITPFAKA